MARDGKFDGIDVESIVRRVLDDPRLRIGDDPLARVPRLPIEEAAASGVDQPASLNANVITTELLKGYLDKTKRIVLVPGAVITPAAKDWLRERDIEICIGTEHPRAQQQNNEIIVGWTENIAATAVDAVAKDINVARLHGTDLTSLVENMTEQVTASAGQGVLLTEATSAAICLANRRCGVRAALAAGVDDVRVVLEAVGANLLVINPRGIATFQLTRIIKAFFQAGPQPCPAKFKQQLD